MLLLAALKPLSIHPESTPAETTSFVRHYMHDSFKFWCCLHLETKVELAYTAQRMQYVSENFFSHSPSLIFTGNSVMSYSLAHAIVIGSFKASFGDNRREVFIPKAHQEGCTVPLVILFHFIDTFGTSHRLANNSFHLLNSI